MSGKRLRSQINRFTDNGSSSSADRLWPLWPRLYTSLTVAVPTVIAYLVLVVYGWGQVMSDRLLSSIPSLCNKYRQNQCEIVAIYMAVQDAFEGIRFLESIT